MPWDQHDTRPTAHLEAGGDKATREGVDPAVDGVTGLSNSWQCAGYLSQGTAWWHAGGMGANIARDHHVAPGVLKEHSI